MIDMKPTVGQQVHLGNWLTAYRHGDRYGCVTEVYGNLVTVRFPDGRTQSFPYGDLIIKEDDHA